MVTSAAANLAHQVATVRSTSTNATPTLAEMEPHASMALTGKKQAIVDFILHVLKVVFRWNLIFGLHLSHRTL